MTLLFVEGFDIYDTVDNAGTNSTAAAGWSFYTQDASYGGMFFNGGCNGGRRLVCWVRNQRRCYVRRSFAANADVVVGSALQLTYADPGPASRQPCSEIISLANAGRTQIVQLAKEGGEAGRLYMHTTPAEEVVYYDVVPGSSQTNYIELQVIAGVAALFVDGFLIGTANVGSSSDYDNLTLGQIQLGYTTATNNISFDDLYLLTPGGAEFPARQGPITTVPLIPAADSASDNDFSPNPASPATRWDKLDDHTGSNPTDQDTTVVEGVLDGATQLVGCTAIRSFTGTAIGYVFSASYKSDQVSYNDMVLVAAKGGIETTAPPATIPIGQYQPGISDVQTQMPDASPVTQANLEAAELGVRLLRP